LKINFNIIVQPNQRLPSGLFPSGYTTKFCLYFSLLTRAAQKKSLNTGAVCKQNDSVTRLLNSQTTYEMILFNGQFWFTVFKQPFVLDGFTCDSHTCKVLLDMRIRFDALWMNITTFTVGIHAKKLGQG
jgi:hypothetical protein